MTDMELAEHLFERYKDQLTKHTDREYEWRKEPLSDVESFVQKSWLGLAKEIRRMAKDGRL